MPFTRRTLAERLWEKATKGEGCWEFTGIRGPTGYGLINEGGRKGRMKRAHRVAWEVANGPIPDGLFVCHRCDNRACIRPDHLFLGTNADNMRDAGSKGRLTNNAKPGVPKNCGEANGNATITADDVRYIRAAYPANATARELGERFGLKANTVRAIARRRFWRSVA